MQDTESLIYNPGDFLNSQYNDTRQTLRENRQESSENRRRTDASEPSD